MHIVYLYDTLCGWCMVASPAIKKLTERLSAPVTVDRLHVNLFDGSYAPVRNEAFLDKVRHVGFHLAPEKTGVRFSEAYMELLQSPDFVLDSQFSAIAVAAAAQVNPERAEVFAQALQDVHFLQGLNPNAYSVAEDIARDVGIDTTQYRQAYESPETWQRMTDMKQLGRQWMQQSGGQGVPQLLLIKEGEIDVLDPYDAEAALGQLNQVMGC